MSGLSTESFIIFLLLSLVMKTTAYNYNSISIVIGHKVESKVLIEKFLITKCVYYNSIICFARQKHLSLLLIYSSITNAIFFTLGTKFLMTFNRQYFCNQKSYEYRVGCI